jgi:hypothetical protein
MSNMRRFRAAGHIARERAEAREKRSAALVGSYRYRVSPYSARFGLTEVA